jgi:hypothetical protein
MEERDGYPGTNLATRKVMLPQEPEVVMIHATELASLRAEIERLTAELTTCRNTAKINLSVAQSRGAEIERMRAALVDAKAMLQTMALDVLQIGNFSEDGKSLDAIPEWQALSGYQFDGTLAAIHMQIDEALSPHPSSTQETKP